MVVQIFSQHQKIILSSSYTELKLILEASNEFLLKTISKLNSLVLKR